jgi:hypothetical protein
LQGEPASSFPPVIVAPTGAQYDSRKLRRWNISEDRLPPGSIVKYRVPTTWERHRSFLIAGRSLHGGAGVGTWQQKEYDAKARKNRKRGA